MRGAIWCVCLFAVAGCRPRGGSDGGITRDLAMVTPDLATAPATPEELALLADGARGMTAMRQTMQVADSLFNFDPTLSVDGTEQSNMMAIMMETTKNLGGCGSVTLTGADDGGAGGTLRVDFGPPPGCLVKGVMVSGKAALTLTVDQVNGITVGLGFTGLVAGAVSLDGALSFVTKNATTFTVTATNFATAGLTVSADLTVAGALLSATIDGTASVTAAGVTRALTFQGIVIHPGGCYATAGTLTVSTPPLSATATFKLSTPQTGIVDATFTSPLGTIGGPYQLPPYGSCGVGDGGTGG